MLLLLLLLVTVWHPALSTASRSLLLPEQPLTVMVVGGFANNTRINDVETVNIGSIVNCVKPKKYPLMAEGGVGMLTSTGAAMVCGGLTIANTTTSACYVYNSILHSWSLSSLHLATPRRFSVAVPFAVNDWWIVGGSDDNDQLIATTEVFGGTSFSAGPTLPLALVDACATRINATHYFVAGGHTTNTTFSAAAFVYDAGHDSWMQVQNMTQGRTGAFCGVVCTQNGGGGGADTVVVAGGYTDDWTVLHSSVLFDLSSRTWSAGPDLPRPAAFGQSVATLDNAFYLLAGTNDDGDLDDVLRFSGGDSDFTVMPQTFQKARSGFAVVVPAKCFGLLV